MGKIYLFECPLCQYRAKVSGGSAAGRHCEIQTVACLDCRELLDVFTKVRRPQGADKAARFPGFFRPEIPPTILVDTRQTALIWQQYELSCPYDTGHRVEVWRDPGRCPRCSCYLEKNGFPWRLWE